MGAQLPELGAELLRAMRRRAGMTQRDLAAAAGVSERTVRGLETGRIGAPHPATVAALVAGMRLDEGAAASLTNAWAHGEQLGPLFSDLVSRGYDIARLFSDSLLRARRSIRVRAISRHLVVATTRLLASDAYELRIEAVADGVGRYLHAYSGGDDSFARLTTVADTWGCELVGRTDVDEINLAAFELSLGRPMRSGETRLIRYRLDQATKEPDDAALAELWRARPPEPSDGSGWRAIRSVDSYTQHVCFSRDRLPSRVWEVRGGEGSIAVRDLELDDFGTAFIHVSAAAPEHYGIRWAWD